REDHRSARGAAQRFADTFSQTTCRRRPPSRRWTDVGSPRRRRRKGEPAGLRGGSIPARNSQAEAFSEKETPPPWDGSPNKRREKSRGESTQRYGFLRRSGRVPRPHGPTFPPARDGPPRRDRWVPNR